MLSCHGIGGRSGTVLPLGHSTGPAGLPTGPSSSCLCQWRKSRLDFVGLRLLFLSIGKIAAAHPNPLPLALTLSFRPNTRQRGACIDFGPFRQPQPEMNAIRAKSIEFDSSTRLRINSVLSELFWSPRWPPNAHIEVPEAPCASFTPRMLLFTPFHPLEYGFGARWKR